MDKRLKFALFIVVMLLATGLRFDAVTRDVRFHPDEAFFATFSRNAAVHGDWMLHGPLDKTPLSLYASALSMHLTGVYINHKNVLDLDLRQGEFAARLPNVFAGVVLVVLVWSLSDGWAAVFAALLTALSPFLIGYSATAFTDPLMLTFMVASVVAAHRHRWTWSGILLALSFASKQQGVFYLPLLAAMMLVLASTIKGKQKTSTGFYADKTGYKSKPVLRPILCLRGRAGRELLSRALRFFIPFVTGIGLVFLWDASRGETSIFAQAAANNNPERVFVRFDELAPRLHEWLTYGATMFGTGWLTWFVTGIGIISLLASFFQKQFSNSLPHVWGRARVGVIFLLYITLYALIHWIFAFNTYDRYLLPLIPLLAVMAGHGLAWIFGRYALVGVVMLGGVMLSLSPVETGYPDDRRHRDDAIIRLAEDLNAHPLGTIVYDHWLGWEMGYYYGAWSDKRRVYYPDPQIQADDALLNPDPAPRYFIAPEDAAYQIWVEAFRRNGFTVCAINAPLRYVMFEIIPFWGDAAASESSSPGPMVSGDEPQSVRCGDSDRESGS